MLPAEKSGLWRICRCAGIVVSTPSILNSVSARIDLRIYDLSGRLVRILASGELVEAGRRTVVWNGRDEGGRSAPSGTYFYRLQAGDYVETKRMTLIK